MDKARNTLRYILKPLVLKMLHKPLGIWLAWAVLIYAAWALTPKLRMFFENPQANMRTFSDMLVVWPIMVLAIITLIRRMLIARIFVSIVVAFMLVHAIYNLQILGIFLVLLGFLGILINRRWFYETLPRFE